MTDEDVRQITLMQKRLYTMSTAAADKALCADGKKSREFLEKVAMVSRQLYFDASDILGKERRGRHA